MALKAPAARVEPVGSGELPTRERILVEAASLFRVRGFAATTMRNIATASGLTPGALYWHFPSKEAILYAIILGLSEDWDRSLTGVIEAPTPTEKLRLHVRMQLAWELQLADAGRALLAVHGTNQLMQFISDEQRAYISSRQEAHFEVLEGILSDGVADGSFRSLDVTPIRHAIYDMCSCPPAWWRPGGELDEEVLIGLYEDLVMRMVKREP